MLKRPTDVALRHFDMVLSTFALRSCVSSANETLCRDRYMQLLNHLRTAYVPNFDVTSICGDLIEFLVGLEFLEDRADLLYALNLCCLCSITVSPVFPDITLENVTTTGRRVRFTDVILPCQISFANVRDSVVFCSDDDYLNRFSFLSASFGRSAFSADYDPWNYFDTFGRSKIYESLLASYRVAVPTPKKALVCIETGDSGSVADENAIGP